MAVVGVRIVPKLALPAGIMINPTVIIPTAANMTLPLCKREYRKAQAKRVITSKTRTGSGILPPNKFPVRVSSINRDVVMMIAFVNLAWRVLSLSLTKEGAVNNNLNLFLET